jgi:hypothetical protein
MPMEREQFIELPWLRTPSMKRVISAVFHEFQPVVCKGIIAKALPGDELGADPKTQETEGLANRKTVKVIRIGGDYGE